MKLQIALIIFILLFTSIASAETGTITVSNISTNTYINSAGVGTATGILNYSIIYWNTSGFNRIEDFRIRSTIAGTTFTYAFNSTPFTIYENGTGGGFFYYDANTSSVYYVFNSDSTFTASPIRIRMDVNITNQINLRCTAGFVVAGGSTAPSVTEPVYINVTDTVTPANRYARCGSVGEGYTTTTSAAETGTYNVTYYNIGEQIIFIGNVTKGGFVNSTYKWQSSSYTYASESTFNKNPFYYDSAPYADGLYLNVSLPTGDFTRQLINASGATGVYGVGNGGSPSGQISYNFSSASTGQNYGFDVSIDSSNYSQFTTYYIYGYDSTGALITGFPLSFNSQTYSSGRFWTFNKAGGYNATLKYCDLFDVTCSNILGVLHTMDSASVLISVPTYNYSVTTDASGYQPGGTIKITISNPSTGNTWLSAFGVENAPQPTIAWNELIQAGETKTITATIPINAPKGSYTLNLATTSSLAPIVAQTIFNVTSAPVGTGVLSVIWDETFVPLSTTGTVTTTSNHNASTLTVTSPTGLQNIYVFPADSINYTNINLNEVGIWNARIVDNNNASNNSQANTTVIAGNPSDNETIQNCMSSLNYVCWDKRQYTQGQAFTLTFKLTPQITDVFRPYLEISNPSGNVVFNQSINMTYSQAQNAYIGSLGGNFDPQAPTGVYFARIKIPNLFGDDETRAESATEVIAGATPTTTEGQVSTTTSTNLLNVLGMVAFYGLLIYVGLLYGLIKLMTSRGAQVSGSSLIYLAVILANLIALIGLFDPFKMYVLVLTWVIAGATFTANRKAVTGGD